METNETTVINGFTVELEFCEDGAVMGSVEKGRFSSSLTVAECGSIEDDYGNELDIPAATLERIMEWAYANGY